MDKRILWALVASLAGGQAMACRYVVPAQIYFKRGSAELSQSQIAKLSEWLNRSYESFPLYRGAAVETGASGDISAEAKALAELRAVNTARALRILLGTDLPIETSSHGYRSPMSRFGENNDFAAIHLYPDIERLKLTDCNPVPIPGFKR